MRKRHRDDVSIGKARWLRWIDYPSDLPNSALQDVDSWLADLAGLWDALETNCVHECCGINAFNLWPDAVRSAVPASRRPEVLGQLSAFRARIASLPAGAVTVSGRLNQLLHRDLMLGIVDHLVDSLDDRERPDET
jgi:hypothetical protein